MEDCYYNLTQINIIQQLILWLRNYWVFSLIFVDIHFMLIFRKNTKRSLKDP